MSICCQSSRFSSVPSVWCFKNYNRRSLVSQLIGKNPSVLLDLLEVCIKPGWHHGSINMSKMQTLPACTGCRPKQKHNSLFFTGYYLSKNVLFGSCRCEKHILIPGTKVWGRIHIYSWRLFKDANVSIAAKVEEQFSVNRHLITLNPFKMKRPAAALKKVSSIYVIFWIFLCEAFQLENWVGKSAWTWKRTAF